MSLGLGLGLGLSRVRGGASDPYINPAIPKIDNVVRAWSLRRINPLYLNGKAVRELRSDGGTETDVLFKNNGEISISGSDAFANTIYEQCVGESSSMLINNNFALCPKVHDSIAGTQKGLMFDGINDVLTIADTDEGLSTAMANYANGWAFSFWYFIVGTGNNQYLINRNDPTSGRFSIYTASGGGLRALIYSSDGRDLAGANQTNKWGMITVVGYTAESVATVKVYVDKADVYTGEAGTIAGGAAQPFALGFRLGAAYFNGSVNDIVVWNDVVLSAADVAAHYDALKGYYQI